MQSQKLNSVSEQMNYENFVFTLHFFALLSKCYKNVCVPVCVCAMCVIMQTMSAVHAEYSSADETQSTWAGLLVVE